MLTIAQSPDLNVLVDKLIRDYRAAFHGEVFARATVIVPNFAIGDWLSQQIARKQGVSAQLDFQLWVEFERNLIDNGENNHRRLSDTAMRWALFAHLWNHHAGILQDAAHPLNPTLRSLLNEREAHADAVAQRLWAYASETSDIFAAYLAMRPDWLAAWQSNRTPSMPVAPDKFQALPPWLQVHYQTVLNTQHHLWVSLFAASYQHRQAQTAAFYRRADSGDGELPKQLFIFAPNDYTAQKLEFLTHLSNSTRVHLYYHTVSSKTFGDIVDSRWLRQLTNADSQNYSIGHELVARYGKQQRDQQRLLENYQLTEQITPIDPVPAVRDTLLSRLQADIRSLDDKISLAEAPLPDDDDSLRIHGCHGFLRQLEILRSEIVRWLNADPSRQLADILIVSPDLTQQQETIRAIFPPYGNYDGYHLPARLTGVTSLDTQNLWLALTAPYTLIKDNFDARKICDILLLADNIAAYQTEHSAMQRLCEALMANGYRRGYDQRHLHDILGITDNDPRYTYTYALDRLVVGYTQRDILLYHNDTIPADDIQLTDRAALEALCQFAVDIEHARREHAASRPISAWLEQLQNRLQSRYTHAQNTPAYQNILTTLRDLSFETHHNDTDQLPLTFILRLIEERLQDSNTSAEPSGVITIGRLNSLSILPYKLIALIGAEHGEYPARPHDRRYNLIDIDQPRPGDRHRDQEDLAAFLNIITVAQENLWITYTATDPDDGEPRLAAQPIQELSNYLQATAPKNLTIVQTHQADPFHPDSHRTHPAPLWYSVAERLKTTGSPGAAWTDLKTATSSTTAPTVAVRQLIPFTQIINALLSPAAAYLRAQQIAERRPDTPKATYEPLTSNHLDNWKIRNALITGLDHPQQRITLPHRPILPIGKAGTLIANEQRQRLDERIASLTLPLSHVKTTQIQIDNHYYSHLLPSNPIQPWQRLSPNTIRSGNTYKIKHLLRHYLEHLLWQSTGIEQASHINYEDHDNPRGHNLSFPAIKQTQAQTELCRYIAIANSAMQTPWLAPVELLWKIANGEAISAALIRNWRTLNYQGISQQLDNADNWDFIFQGQSDNAIETAMIAALTAQQDLLKPLVHYSHLSTKCI